MDHGERGALGDQLASLDRHAQLTRYFSAIAELPVYTVKQTPQGRTVS